MKSKRKNLTIREFLQRGVDSVVSGRSSIRLLWCTDRCVVCEAITEEALASGSSWSSINEAYGNFCDAQNSWWPGIDPNDVSAVQFYLKASTDPVLDIKPREMKP